MSNQATAKAAKVARINEAISRSETAKKFKAYAMIGEDGRISYGMTKRYQMSATFSEILGLLHGEDMRALKGASR